MRPEFGDDITNVTINDPDLPAVMHCTRMAGRAIIRVVGRCNDAQENCNLDLSDCQLMQIPDAVYHLMRNTVLQTCDLSTNSISRIGARFAEKFPVITDLNLSHNRISGLPEQLSDLNQLKYLDMSHNNLDAVPSVALKMPLLEKLSVAYNKITHIDVNSIKEATNLRLIDLRENPLSQYCRDSLIKEFAVSEELIETDKLPLIILSQEKDDEDLWS